MTWTVGKFHTSPGVQPPEAEEGPFYLAAVPSSAEGRWWCPHGWDADGRLCPEKRWLTKNEEAPKVTPQPRPARPEGFIPPQGPLAECQNCGNFESDLPELGRVEGAGEVPECSDRAPDSSALKPYTKYRCPTDGCGCALWTGAMTAHRPSDDVCLRCGVPWAEVVEDGHRYRVEWEMDSGFGWHPRSRETDDRVSAEDQAATLRRWAETGEEPVRNVRLVRSATTWEEVRS